jgi:hypothetical protein
MQVELSLKKDCTAALATIPSQVSPMERPFIPI